MKRITLSVLAAATMLTALPATVMAQPRPYTQQNEVWQGRDRDDRGYNTSGQWQTINQRQAELERRITRSIQRGTLARREAVRIRADFRVIAQREAQYRRSRPGLTRAERADLDLRFNRLEARVRYESRDDDRRGDRGNGYGNGPRR